MIPKKDKDTFYTAILFVLRRLVTANTPLAT